MGGRIARASLPKDAHGFTDREATMLAMICNGDTSKRIALRLHMQERNVKLVRTTLMRMTRTTNAAQLAAWCGKHGYADNAPADGVAAEDDRAGI